MLVREFSTMGRRNLATTSISFGFIPHSAESGASEEQKASEEQSNPTSQRASEGAEVADSARSNGCSLSIKLTLL